MTVNKKILVISENPEGTNKVETLLKAEGYNVVFADDELAGIEKTRLETPDLILLDTVLPYVTGLAISHRLKEDPVTQFIPIIALVDLVDSLSGTMMKIEAEAYLLKPFNSEELKFEIQRLLKRTSEQLSANPLTKLPGNITIEENTANRIKRKEKIAVCYLDLDDFKAYNDYYGFHRGDGVIKLLAKTLVNASNFKGTRNDLVGHIGGDDFILVTVPDKVDDVCSYIMETFDKEIASYYDGKDIKRGYITTKDRQFQLHNFPVMTISISVATNEKRKIEHYGKLVDILVEMKKYVKSIKDRKSSIFIKDRRKEDL